MRVLTQEQFVNIFNMLGNEAAENMFLGHDIYHISRLYRRKGLQEFVDAIHDSGGLCVFDTDDDLTEEFRELDGKGDEFLETCKAFDLVTVSTPFLADRIERHLGYRPIVLPNQIDVDWFRETSAEGKRMVDGLTVGFIGTSSHEDDWIYPVEALKRIGEEYPEITVIAAGYTPKYLYDLPNLRSLGGVPYYGYPALIRQLDIVCCSLDDEDVFNLSKSGIKALEAMASERVLPNGRKGGAVPICTDMTLYRRVVNHGHNGYLTSNDRWYEALKHVIENEQERLAVAQRGYKWVKKNRDIRDNYVLWMRTYKNLLRERA